MSTDTTNQQAWLRATAFVDARFGDTEHPCKHGHLECANEDKGECWNEAVNARYDRECFIQRLLEEEANEELVDIWTGERLGKRGNRA